MDIGLSTEIYCTGTYNTYTQYTHYCHTHTHEGQHISLLLGLEGGAGWDPLDPVSPGQLALSSCLFLLCSVVLSFVSVPTASLRKRLPTHPTLVWFFSRVCQLVLLKTGHLRKTLRTTLKLTNIRPLPCVRSDMVL